MGENIDLKEVKELDEKSCEGDDMQACNILGGLYAEGLGVAVDYGRANELYTQAGEGDDMDVCSP